MYVTYNRLRSLRLSSDRNLIPSNDASLRNEWLVALELVLM